MKNPFDTNNNNDDDNSMELCSRSIGLACSRTLYLCDKLPTSIVVLMMRGDNADSNGSGDADVLIVAVVMLMLIVILIGDIDGSGD